jgi:teichuronic acid biosynthesis glycosyltransferase TuaC
MSAAKAPLLDFVQRDPGADVLVVTNMWPDDERPVYGIFVKRQVDSLRAAGVRCDVVYLRGYRSAAAYPFAAARFLAATLAWRGRYRLVHVHAGETALAARFFVGPPMLVSYCGDDVLGSPREDGSIPLASRIRSAVVRTHASLFSATITKSQEMHDRLPVAARRLNVVIPNGVDMESFRLIGRTEARRELGWDERDRVVLFAGTKVASPRKRQRLAAAARDHAAERIRNVRLHIAGSTPPEQMPLLMNAADCLIVTSSIEGSPNVVKEALMCNLPVVATPSGDIPMLLEGVDPSYLCPPDAAALGDALVACLTGGRRSNGRDEKGGSLASAAIAERVLDLYERLSEPHRLWRADIAGEVS